MFTLNVNPVISNVEMSFSSSNSFFDQLQKNFPLSFYSTNPETVILYSLDSTRGFKPNASGVVFPRTTDDVAKFLSLCSKWDIKVVPSGGRTGLAGGAVASQGEWILSLEKIDQIINFDPLSQTIIVGAGIITLRVQEYLLQYGLEWPVRFAAEGASQIGGNVATNVGGLNVIRYGMARDWILGLKVVLSDGKIIDSTYSPKKNNTGYDLKQLFIGSEGTLGVITEVALKLMPINNSTQSFFCGFESYSEVEKFYLKLSQNIQTPIKAFEVLDLECLHAVSEVHDLRSPLSTEFPYYVLFEVFVQPQLESFFFDQLFQWFEHGILGEIFHASQSDHKKLIWQIRERISESLTHLGNVQKYDLSVSVSQFFLFVQEVESEFRSDQQFQQMVRLFFFGHMGDGNVHFNLVFDSAMSDNEILLKKQDADKKVFALIQKFSGSISAEHGIGFLKRSYLQVSRSNDEIDFFRKIKLIFDPKNILNPGKIFI